MNLIAETGSSGGDEEVDESSAQEIFEDKLKEAIDGILEKR